jgi:DNA processing protein
MTEATIIESADRGSLITANGQWLQPRCVCGSGRVTINTLGCNNLIKTQKSNVLTSAADLVYILNWDIQAKTKPVQKQLFVTDDDEQKYTIFF